VVLELILLLLQCQPVIVGNLTKFSVIMINLETQTWQVLLLMLGLFLVFATYALKDSTVLLLMNNQNPVCVVSTLKLELKNARSALLVRSALLLCSQLKMSA
jgi:hypothetical protein